MGKSTYSHRILDKANMLKENNLYPFFRAIEASDGTTITHDGIDMVMIGSNNYLGLTHHPYV